MVPFLGLLGYQIERPERAEVVVDKTYALSHRLPGRDGFPVHIVGPRHGDPTVSSDRSMLDVKATAGPRMSPPALLQEYLNLTEHLYGLVTNGLSLRHLRDRSRLIKLSFLDHRIKCGNAIVGLAHLSDLGTRNAVASALKRLKAAETIRQLARGLYDYPVEDPVLGKVAPSTDAAARALVVRDAIRLQPSGDYAANLLGLSEQVPARVVFLTDGPPRKVKIGKREILLKRATPRNMATAGRKSAGRKTAMAQVATLPGGTSLSPIGDFPIQPTRAILHGVKIVRQHEVAAGIGTRCVGLHSRLGDRFYGRMDLTKRLLKTSKNEEVVVQQRASPVGIDW